MNHIEANSLLDLYGPLLSSRQKEVAECCWQEDYSLSETAELLGISRAAVSKSLHSAQESLQTFENTLHLAGLLESLASFEQELNEADAKKLRELLENWKMEEVSL